MPSNTAHPLTEASHSASTVSAPSSADRRASATSSHSPALFGGQESIRDFIAFPKNNQGRDMMLDAPSRIDQVQMEELFLQSTYKGEK